MSQWVRAKKSREPGEKVRIVLLVDPHDPANEQLMQFHDSLPYRSYTQTYVQALRNHAAQQLAGQGGSSSRPRPASPAKKGVAISANSASAEGEPSIKVSESAGLQQATTISQVHPNPIGESTTNPPREQAPSDTGEEAVKTGPVSFSETAQDHFNMVE